MRKDRWRATSLFTESVGPGAYPRTASVGRGCLWPEQASLSGAGRAACRDRLVLSSQEDLWFFVRSLLVPVSWGERKCLGDEVICEDWLYAEDRNPLRVLVEKGVRSPPEASCASW